MNDVKSPPRAGRKFLDPVELRKAYHAGTLPMFLLEHRDAYPAPSTPVEIWDAVLKIRVEQGQAGLLTGQLIVCGRRS